MDKAEQEIKNDYNVIEPKTLEMIGEQNKEVEESETNEN
jgi:hypothetical protein